MAYGVDPPFIVALWGNYGRFNGGFSDISWLATLAYRSDGSERRNMFARSSWLRF
jgi:membrane-bound lytic murein transglycosylase B